MMSKPNSALRETFVENDDDYGEYIGKVNLLTSPEVFRELQETRLQQNIDERNLNPQKTVRTRLTYLQHRHAPQLISMGKMMRNWT